MSEVEELQAEVERLRAHEVANGCIPRPVYEHLAKVAREHADALDRVEELADREDARVAEANARLAKRDAMPKTGRPLRLVGQLTTAEVRAALAVPVTGDTEDALPLHRTEAGYPNCSTCDGGGCPDCTDPA